MNKVRTRWGWFSRVITSSHNPRLAAARRLRRARDRKATGLTTVEGPFLLAEAIAAGVMIHDVYTVPDDPAAARLCEEAGVQPTPVSREALVGLASSVSPRGPVAVISIPESAPLRAADSIVMWDVADPGNAGTIVRSAAAFGFQVVATQGCVDLWSPKVVRAGVGGHFRSPPVEILGSVPGALVAAGLRPFVAEAGSATPPEVMVQTPGPVALIVGNEAHGVPATVAEDMGVETLSLEMPGGTESLNAGVAASILMYLRSAG